jgi:hypothetical protein
MYFSKSLPDIQARQFGQRGGSRGCEPFPLFLRAKLESTQWEILKITPVICDFLSRSFNV